MACNDRIGNRKIGDQRTVRCILQMESYLVVMDTEATECCYFTGLYDGFTDYVKNKESYLVGYIYTK